MGPGGATSGGPSATSAGAPDTDAAAWSQWWSLNRDGYLALKRAVQGERAVTGSDDFFLGRGQRNLVGLALRPSDDVIRAQVVPALIAALAGEKDTDVVTGVLMALAKIGDARGADESLARVIEPYLAHANQELHETAAIALGVLANPTSAPMLVELAHDSEAGRALSHRTRVPVRTRAFAAYGLGLIGYGARSETVKSYVVHHLARCIREEGLPTHDLAVAGVIAMGLVRLENGSAPDPEAPEGLRPSASRQAQLRFLLELFLAKTTHERVRAYAPVALARLAQDASPSYKDELARAFTAVLQVRSPEGKLVCHGVVSALALLGDDDDDPHDVAIRAALTGAAKTGDRLARHLALVSLARVAGRKGAGPAGDGPEAARALLAEHLARGTTPVRPWAGLALGLLERHREATGLPASDEARRAVRDALKNAASPSEEGAYSIALGLMLDAAATELLVQKVASGDENVRGHAAIALGLAGARAAIPALQAVARASVYRAGLMRESAIALGLLGDKEIQSALLERMAAAERMIEQVALAAAVGVIGDARAVDPLIALLLDKEKTETARAFAAVALGSVCDKEELPWNSKLAADALWWEAPATLTDPGGKGVLDLF